MPQTGLQGLRVLALESRRAKEIAALIRSHGGEPILAPALRELPLESNRSALDFARDLMAGDFDLVIFLTGVGVRALIGIVETQVDRQAFLEALRGVKIAARGPKPLAVLREFKIPVAITAPEPSTWHELMKALKEGLGAALEGIRIAVQEYGAPSTELLAALAASKAVVTSVPVYQWALPEDLEPLRTAILAIAKGEIDVLVLMNAAQIAHLFKVADQMGKTEALIGGLKTTVILSIGPSTSEELRRFGLAPDFEPSHPKMGFMINEAAQAAQGLVGRKRAAAP